MPNNSDELEMRRIYSKNISNQIWYASALIVIAIVIAILMWMGINIFKKAITAINTSNQRIVEKTGVEVTSDLNQSELISARQIMVAKELPKELPNNIRNIFNFESYTNLTTEATEQGNIDNIE
jgi:uncharacterized membrane protein YhiD involved in acid resistance